MLTPWPWWLSYQLSALKQWPHYQHYPHYLKKAFRGLHDKPKVDDAIQIVTSNNDNNNATTLFFIEPIMGENGRI